jgi:hypothetical protein
MRITHKIEFFHHINDGIASTSQPTVQKALNLRKTLADSNATRYKKAPQEECPSSPIKAEL